MPPDTRLFRLWFSALALALACACAPGVAAAAGVFLEDLTWTELRDAQRDGSTAVIVPIGGTEQNGPHMALGKHNARVRQLAQRIAATLGRTLVAPVLAYVPESPGHLRFPGTLDVPADAFTGLLDGAVRSLRRGGFRDIVLIGDSGDYQRLLRDLADRLNREWKSDPTRVHYVAAYYRTVHEGYEAALKAQGLSAAEIGTHAATADTSLQLATVADMVRTDRLVDAARGSPGNGVTGDPRPSSEALGRLGAELVVRESVAAIRAAIDKGR